MSFKAAKGGKYRGAVSETEENRIMRNLKRDWNRHPEIRAEHGGSFKRYVTAARYNTTFG